MRLLRFLHLYNLLKIKGIVLPTFFFSYGKDYTVSDIWKHSKKWRFNWE